MFGDGDTWSHQRVAVGIQARIPLGVWVALFVLSALGMLGMGYQSGITGSKRSGAVCGLRPGERAGQRSKQRASVATPRRSVHAGKGRRIGPRKLLDQFTRFG